MSGKRLSCIWAAVLATMLGLTVQAGRCAPKKAFTFAIVGDRTGGAVEGVFEQVLDEISFLNPDLIVTVGDHIEGYEADSSEIEAQWDYIVDLMERTGIAYLLTAGNHDIWDAQSGRVFRRRFGSADWTVERYGCLFISLDVSTLYTAEAVSPETMVWLEGQLQAWEGRGQAFVFYHKPFWCEDFSSGRANAFHELFKHYDVSAVFTGHYHRHFYTERDGVRYFGVSSSGGALAFGGREKGAFYSYLLAKVEGESLRVQVMEPGAMVAPEVVTMEDAVRIAGIETHTVSMSPVRLDDIKREGAAQATVSIHNQTEYTLQDTAKWSLRGTWHVEPSRSYVEVPPGEVGTLTVRAVLGDPAYPVPLLSLHVPHGANGSLEVSEPLNLKRLTHAYRCSVVPRIDGSLDDPAWGVAAVESSYFGQGIRPPSDATLVRLLHDGNKMYLAVECLDSRAGSIAAAATERDGFGGGDDYVMFLFEPAPGMSEFYQISFNPAGTIFDKRIEICPFGTYVLHPEWDGPVEVATRMEADRWIVEAACALDAFGAEALPGSQWGFNFRRMHKRLGVTSDFQTPFWYDSDRLGLIEFQ